MAWRLALELKNVLKILQKTKITGVDMPKKIHAIVHEQWLRTFSIIKSSASGVSK